VLPSSLTDGVARSLSDGHRAACAGAATPRMAITSMADDGHRTARREFASRAMAIA